VLYEDYMAQASTVDIKLQDTVYKHNIAPSRSRVAHLLGSK